jgi:hypothetical protein
MTLPVKILFSRKTARFFRQTLSNPGGGRRFKHGSNSTISVHFHLMPDAQHDALDLAKRVHCDR